MIRTKLLNRICSSIGWFYVVQGLRWVSHEVTPLVKDGKSVRSREDRAKARQQSRPDWKPPPDHPWRRSSKTGAETVAR
ncbi:MAG: hypothetical protein F4056_07010 [Chloroflexi bacterium]|nr:hypothetical protein [Gammaproteobacteria bacterium]MYH47327.1 hypothetical protein [Gammaproteobacteria bacterium]MYI83036.1 hypothetical protein [Chloroflexota bacterium]MYL12945.1 hypothetical protein [Gammaproteobacteria bacterium]